jgi:hypothetical protein
MIDAVKLLWHHVPCILVHSGNGYTPCFKTNTHQVIAKINDGAPIELVQGPDDICAGFSPEGKTQHWHSHGCSKNRSVQFMDRMASFEIRYWLQMPPLKKGEAMTLDKNTVSWLRLVYSKNLIRSACQKCGWKEACSEVAANKFAGVKLMPDALPKFYPFNLSHPLRRSYAQSWSDQSQHHYLKASPP